MLHESLLASVPKRAAADDHVRPVHAVRVRVRGRRRRGAAAGRLRAIEAAERPRLQARPARKGLLLARPRGEVSRHQRGAQSRPGRALGTREERSTSQLLYWSAASLGAAISAGGLDHPELLIDWPVVRALAERALALDETWSNGAIPELMITVESQGEALGGSEERARQVFRARGRDPEGPVAGSLRRAGDRRGQEQAGSRRVRRSCSSRRFAIDPGTGSEPPSGHAHHAEAGAAAARPHRRLVPGTGSTSLTRGGMCYVRQDPAIDSLSRLRWSRLCRSAPRRRSTSGSRRSRPTTRRGRARCARWAPRGRRRPTGACG